MHLLNTAWRITWGALLGVFFVCTAAADPLDWRYQNHEATYRLNDDATYTVTRSWKAKALTQKGVDELKQGTIWHSTSVEQLGTIQAHTLKADGRVLPVPKDSFQIESNSGKDKGNPAFSDHTRVGILFPDVTVGDSIELSYTIDLKEAVFPGHFSLAQYFSKETAYDKLRVVIDWPAQIKARYEHKDMTMQLHEQGSRNQVVWTLSNPEPEKRKDRSYGGVFNPSQIPGLSFTTFGSYEQIANAYGARAIPKAKPTATVQDLVNKTTAGKETELDKTRAIYNWVARNIAYAGNCVGIGAVVPRDLDFVLTHRMGDCKDHATLLQAMLSAAGIVSNQVLVNAGSMYVLPALPVASQVNHVFTYVPSLDVFLDSTSDSTPFGYLPHAVQDKPVLHVGASHPSRQRTPATPVGRNVQDLTMTLKLNETGAGSGNMRVSLQGEFAAAMRSRFRDWPQENQKKFVRESLRQMRLRGDGAIRFDDPEPLLDKFEYDIQFTVQELIEPSGGVLPIAPLFGSSAPVSQFLHAFDRELDVEDGSCHNGMSSETYTIELPKNLRIASVPPKASFSTEYLDYSQAFELKGNSLKVQRRLNDKSPSGFCSAQVMEKFMLASERGLKLFRVPVVYQAAP
jgi:hypothetical protein